MLSIQREETKQKPMKISYNREENGRPEKKKILSNGKKKEDRLPIGTEFGAGGGIILLKTALLNCVPRINSHLSWRLY